jgi:hypothetical protein
VSNTAQVPDQLAFLGADPRGDAVEAGVIANGCGSIPIIRRQRMTL